jgi:hypothetical protein
MTQLERVSGAAMATDANVDVGLLGCAPMEVAGLLLSPLLSADTVAAHVSLVLQTGFTLLGLGRVRAATVASLEPQVFVFLSFTSSWTHWCLQVRQLAVCSSGKGSVVLLVRGLGAAQKLQALAAVRLLPGDAVFLPAAPAAKLCAATRRLPRSRNILATAADSDHVAAAVELHDLGVVVASWRPSAGGDLLAAVWAAAATGGLVGVKWLPALEPPFAKLVTPYEVGDTEWRKSVTNLTQQPCLVLVVSNATRVATTLQPLLTTTATKTAGGSALVLLEQQPAAVWSLMTSFFVDAELAFPTTINANVPVPPPTDSVLESFLAGAAVIQTLAIVRPGFVSLAKVCLFVVVGGERGGANPPTPLL